MLMNEQIGEIGVYDPVPLLGRSLPPETLQYGTGFFKYYKPIRDHQTTNSANGLVVEMIYRCCNAEGAGMMC